MDDHLIADDRTMAQLRASAASGERAVVMLNINRYRPEAGFPDGGEYRAYLGSLLHAVGSVGGSVLWRAPVEHQVIGCPHDESDEVLAVWYPTYQAFLDLPRADGADEMFRGRRRCVANAVILALPAEAAQLTPTGHDAGEAVTPA